MRLEVLIMIFNDNFCVTKAYSAQCSRLYHYIVLYNNATHTWNERSVVCKAKIWTFGASRLAESWPPHTPIEPPSNSPTPVLNMFYSWYILAIFTKLFSKFSILLLFLPLFICLLISIVKMFILVFVTSHHSWIVSKRLIWFFHVGHQVLKAEINVSDFIVFKCMTQIPGLLSMSSIFTLTVQISWSLKGKWFIFESSNLLLRLLEHII